MAAQRSDTYLYSILTRVTAVVSSTSVNAALSYYSAEEAKVTILDLIKENPLIVIALIFVVLALLTVIFMQHRIIGTKKVPLWYLIPLEPALLRQKYTSEWAYERSLRFFAKNGTYIKASAGKILFHT